ncbi:MAG: hypothetical protein WBE68_16745, partial [Candidatus Nitrosopolaris sp.]
VEALDYVAKDKVKVIAETYTLQDIVRAYQNVAAGNVRFRVLELKDDTKDNSPEPIRLATYSNNKSTVWTHTSIFETLWIQSESYQINRTNSKTIN